MRLIMDLCTRNSTQECRSAGLHPACLILTDGMSLLTFPLCSPLQSPGLPSGVT